MSRQWIQVLGQVLGSNTSMKYKKAIKKAVKLAQDQGSCTRTKEDRKKELELLLARNEIRGLKVSDGRIQVVDASSLKQDGKDEEQSNTSRAQNEVKQPPQPNDTPEYPHSKKRRIQVGGTEPLVDEELRWRARQKRHDIKSGPFSAVEKRAILESLENSAISRGLSTTDYSWLIQGPGNRSSDIAGVWKEVAMHPSLKHRTIKSIAATGIRMIHPYARRGPWTADEDEKLRKLVEEKGPNWVTIGSLLERTREAVRDRWKEIRLGSSKAKGHWNEDEVSRLKTAVEEYLNAKAKAQAGRSHSPHDRRIVLDDIDWELISSRVGTRSGPQCMEKWYDQLSPSMVSRGEWGRGDDRRMLKALWSLRPSAEYMVKWDDLVEGRTASQTRRRWRLMIKAVSGYREKEFDEILSSLVETYMPHLLESHIPHSEKTS